MSRLWAAPAHLIGWRFEGPVPTAKKYVALAAPHTSNWDGLLMMMMAETIHLDMKWLVKSTAAVFPIRAPLLAFGAVPVDRSKKANMVEQMVEQFRVRDDFVLFLSPEGTRKRTEYWKSGFYQIARGAKVKVACSYLDYATKRAGIGEPMEMTGDVRVDMDRIRAFYAERNPRGLRHEEFGPIRLREEDA